MRLATFLSQLGPGNSAYPAITKTQDQTGGTDMSFFSNLKIANQFLIAIAFFSLLVIATGLTGYWGIASLGQETQDSLNSDGVIELLAAEVTTHTLSLRRYEKDSFLNIAKPEKVAGYKSKWQATYAKLEKSLTSLLNTTYLPDEQAAVRKMKQGATDYRNGITKVWKDISANKIKDTAAGNHALKIYKEPIRALSENAVSLSEAANLRMSQLSGVVSAKTVSFSRIIAMLCGFSVLVLIGFGIFMSRSLTRPIRRLVNMIQEMENGHLEERLNIIRGDEIGLMAQAMDSCADTIQHEMVTNLEKLAAGDLTFQVQPRDHRDKIRNSLSNLAADLNNIMKKIQISGEQIAAGSLQVSDSSQALSQGATESASSLEEISASLNEMTTKVKENAGNADLANSLSDESQATAEKGSAQMTEMVEAMGEIAEAGKNISKIIKVIDEIAFQTNLLALNAAVEAARAGTAGKGFAVVAEEVRNLAGRSAKAARETADMIESSVEKTARGSEIADRTSAALEEILSGISQASDLVAEIAEASSEQAQGINEITAGLNQIDQVTQKNTSSAERSAAAAEELSGQAGQLQEMLSRFTIEGGSSAAQLKTYSPGSTTPPHPTPPQSTAGPVWGEGDPGGGSATKPVIALDDSDFGRY